MEEQKDISASETAVKYVPSSGPVPGRRYTYSDYCTWDDDKRYELIDGIPIVMDAPNRKHQGVIGELHLQLGNFLKDKPCKVYLSPFDVRFNADGADDTVLQPDILVICDHSKLTDAGVSGVPDMVIEVLSPSNSLHDKARKFNLYEKYGVREYWIVDPECNHVAVHILDNGRYYTKAYTDEDTVRVHILEDCEIDLSEVFAE